MASKSEARRKAMGEVLRLASKAMRAQAEAKRAPPKPPVEAEAKKKEDDLSDEDYSALVSVYDKAGATPEA